MDAWKFFRVAREFAYHGDSGMNQIEIFAEYEGDPPDGEFNKANRREAVRFLRRLDRHGVDVGDWLADEED